MHISIATSSEPKLWYKDSNLLKVSLNKLGCNVDICVWDDININWAQYDAVVIDSTWDYVKNYIQFIEWCNTISQQTLLINDINIIKENTNKSYLVKLQNNAISMPKTRIINNPKELSLYSSAFLDKVVIKPIINAGGSNTYLFNTYQQAVSSNSIQDLLRQKPVIIQQYIPQIKTLGEYSAVFFNGGISHCVIKKASKNDFRVQHEYGGSVELVEPPKSAIGLYKKATMALNCIPVYCRLDFIELPAGPLLMELEMTEPDKFLNMHPKGADTLAKAIKLRVS